ncbi:phosphoribosylformylglycinamidine cyclo-ligase [Arenicella chitinivorans]|uniref:Phosphoribosylformylglycinamidine cyclo-ligase n=1 Tax=Arenicella chitinivorans TaxID=1329800 RepID=A0A918RG91_9GAMM|nr:phosphoribosylformylglycinamidine cyclo-ligase [Arenicella chitinivorans]GGZ98887.1 phosphoribosylformylglycinamidine cyclo-ligase [Arenicella chitinivorans]
MSQSDKPDSLSYRDAGVDIDAGDAFIDVIKPVAKRTQREGSLSGLGGFGALFQIPKGYEEPILVSGTDGVGTKLKLAFDLNKHDTIGIDLVAMCVNDVLVQGAEPLFFLDYFATGKLTPEIAAQVVTGIGEGCVQANAALIGGETAEMPGMYQAGEYDLAGFCVGAVEKSEIIDGSKVASGDVLIGLASSGAHSNGYSLIRKVIDTYQVPLDTQLDGKALSELVLAPTRIYVRPVLSLMKSIPVNALAHITGGGIPGNLNRVLPQDCHAVVQESAWEWPALFRWLQETANIEQQEMYRTFNCGVGMILVVKPEHADEAIAHLNAAGEIAFLLGDIRAGAKDPQIQIV